MASSGEEIRSFRLKKLETLQKNGINPYPSKVSFKISEIKEVRKNFKKLEKSKKSLGIAGRVMAKREHGGSIFFDLLAGESFQVFMSKDKIGEENFNLFSETIDVGDFVAVFGKLFTTKKKEPTIDAQKWEIISKSLLPLPEKWHGLSDVEERFRKRYLDLLMNKEAMGRFARRSAIISEMRNFFDSSEFIEVETPMLHSVAGGALAKPFITRHNALNIDLYLRIAPELYLKKLLVGGFKKVYEIGKSFRNEGIDSKHNPEFTTIEWYAAYWDEEDMMQFTEKFFKHIVKKITGKSEIEYQGKAVSFSGKFQRVTFKDALARYAQIIDYDKESRESFGLIAKRFGIEPEAYESKAKIADEIFKKVCRPHMQKPIFLTNHPLEISPLAKKHENKNEVRRFQLIAGGLELVNAFSELNDPLDQLERFKEQEKMKRAGEKESHPIDEEYTEALEYGMPPAAGAGLGIDRLVMLLTDAENIKEVILFPTMRPK
ncbi:MAG: lysine--tRNA ligase [Patescibacteria group bacterium]